MKVKWEKDEWYPVYTLVIEDVGRRYGKDIEISADLWNRYVIAMEEFNEVQSLLAEFDDKSL